MGFQITTTDRGLTSNDVGRHGGGCRGCRGSILRVLFQIAYYEGSGALSLLNLSARTWLVLDAEDYFVIST